MLLFPLFLAGFLHAQAAIPEVSVITTAATRLLKFTPGEGVVVTCGDPKQPGTPYPAYSIFKLELNGGDRARVQHFLTGDDGLLCLSEAMLVPESTTDVMVRLGRIEDAKLPAPLHRRLAMRRVQIGDSLSSVHLACGRTILDETEEETAAGVTTTVDCIDQKVTLKKGRVASVVRKKQLWERGGQ